MNIEKAIKDINAFIRSIKSDLRDNENEDNFKLVESLEMIIQEREQDKKRIQELENRIDKLIIKMRKNGSNYWADETEKVKE